MKIHNTKTLNCVTDQCAGHGGCVVASDSAVSKERSNSKVYIRPSYNIYRETAGDIDRVIRTKRVIIENEFVSCVNV
jgi:hypothetical protein